LYSWSILAAKMKSLSVRPLILCVQVVISTFPQLLRQLTNVIYELEGSAKVRKLEGRRDVVFFDDIPTVHLRERRDPHPLSGGTPHGKERMFWPQDRIS
jgi:hypothetical protein